MKDEKRKTQKVLRTIDLVKIYREREVVKNVRVHVRQGEVVGLLGPNGAGKTTTFYMVVGMIRPDAGKVLLEEHCGPNGKDKKVHSQGDPRKDCGVVVNETDLTHLPMHERALLGIGYLAQEASAFRKLTVEDNIYSILEFLPLTAQEKQARLKGLMEEFGVAHLKGQKAYTLSGGERRRVEIARALATNPHFMLLDEPFVGIDPIAVLDIQKCIRKLARRGIGILITDHNVRETLSITSRAYILYQGEVLLSGGAKFLANNEKAKKIYLGEKFTL